MIAAVLLGLIGLLAPQPAAAQDRPQLPCPGTDKACAEKAMQDHPVRAIDGWSHSRALPLDERLGAAPAQLVEYLNLDNIVNGFPERPRAARLDPAFLADVRGAVADLPAQIWRLFDQRLIGLYFVEDLGGTGFTDVALDRNRQPAAAYVVLDAAVLARQSANAWATWKENTPFKAQPGYRLEARIEDGSSDNRRNAIQYILLHELGHVLSVGANIHPRWDLAPKEVPDTAQYPYFNLSWKLDRPRSRYRSQFDAQFVQRERVVYYFGARLAASEMVPTYANVARTNFPSLYAATRPGDDFAEAFASYVHVVLMKRPWEIRISRNGKLLMNFKSCWDQPRCAAKRAILEQLLGS